MNSNANRFIVGEECWHSFGQHKMRYLRVEPTSGEAKYPPLVMIHGFLASCFSWRHNLQTLAQNRVVYAIDLLGTGYSDRPSPALVSYSMRGAGERVLQFISERGMRGVDLLGTSHGGAVSLAAAISDRQRRNEVVGRLVLVAPANPYMRAGKLRIWFFNTRPGSLAVRAIVSNFPTLGPVALGRMYFDRKKITQQTRDGYNHAIALDGTTEYARAVLKTWYKDMAWIDDSIESLRDTPVLLIWGTADKVVPAASAEPLHARLPESKLVLLARAGHLPYEEIPDEFNRTLLEYLNGAPPESNG